MASDPFVSAELAAGRLCRPFDPVITGDIGFFVVMPKRPRNPKAVQRMRDWLIAQSRPDGPVCPV